LRAVLHANGGGDCMDDPAYGVHGGELDEPAARAEAGDSVGVQGDFLGQLGLAEARAAVNQGGAAIGDGHQRGDKIG
jgi:hypothetical protein